MQLNLPSLQPALLVLVGHYHHSLATSHPAVPPAKVALLPASMGLPHHNPRALPRTLVLEVCIRIE